MSLHWPTGHPLARRGDPKPVILDPHSLYMKAVSWSSNAADWDKPAKAIIRYDWETLTKTEPELQACLACKSDAVRGVRQTLLEIRKILVLLQEQR